MVGSKKIRIFVSSHKDTEYVKDDVFVPIQVGCGLAEHQEISEFLHDNKGENISDKNLRFCELTAQYWVWKHEKDADYVGFFHYRRYLSFNPNLNEKPDIWGSLIEPTIDDQTIKKYGWDGEHISNVVDGYDIVLPEKRNIRMMPNMGKNMRQQFYKGDGFLHEKDLNIMMDVLAEKYPEFIPDAERYLSGHTTYLNNMFIMKRTIFDEYCKWLFDIIFECDKRINYTDYSIEAMRTPGHLAERLLNIYIMHIVGENNYKIKELPTVTILNTTPFEDLDPAFKKENVALVFSANDYYAPYLATILESIRENSSKEKNYDILILNKDIRERNKKRLLSIMNDKKNFSLRFIDMMRYEKQFSELFLRGHFTVETWFRLMLPDILKKYKKVLYLDSDMVVESDVANLYDTDIDGYLLAACHDPDTAGLYDGFDSTKKEYMDKILKIKKPYDYFQAGVILFNLEEFRKVISVKEMMKKAAEGDWELLDQDVLNYLAQGRVKFVDMSWNVMYDWRYMRMDKIIGLAPKYLQDQYREARKHPKIIHYAGPDKPWDDPEVDFAEVFWKYCRNTNYYEVVLKRMSRNNVRVISRKRRIFNAGKRVASKALPQKTTRGRIARSMYEKAKVNISRIQNG